MAFYNGKALHPHLNWQLDEWEVFYHDPDLMLRQMLKNLNFKGQIDYATYVGLDKTEKQS